MAVKVQKDSPKKLAEFLPFITSRLNDGVTNLNKIFIELQARGYRGSYGSLYKFLRGSKKRNSYGVSKHSRPIRFETKPGEQAQVDWGSCGNIEINGKKRKLYAFVYILSWSRMMYIEFVVGQMLPVLQQCHLNAFNKLGIPNTIVYDNMKTVITGRSIREDKNRRPIYNSGFQDFARYYGFNIYLCTPNKPRSKGKVESAVKYLKKNFMQGLRYGRDFSTLEDINKRVRDWLDKVANVRIHKTTSESPTERWDKERNQLQFPKDFPVYPISVFGVRRSTQHGMLQYKGNFYSLPFSLSGKDVLVEEINKSGVVYVNVYYENKIVANHELSQGKGEWISKDEHSGVGNFSLGKYRKTAEFQGGRRAKLFPKVAFARDLDYYNQLILGKSLERNK